VFPKISEKRKKELEKFDSWVLFEIIFSGEGWKYKQFLSQILIEFMCNLDKNKDKYSVVRGMTWNGDEGGLSLHIDDFYISHCKMYCFNGGERGNYGQNSELWKGVLFRDHNDGVWDVFKIHLISDKFEEFLEKKKIKHKRTNREV